MKFTLPITVFAIVAAVDAAAIAEPEAQWCQRPGQSCWKAKREAEALADAAAQWCQRPGQSCWKAKREAQPEAQWCQRPGQSCWKAKRDANPDANADAEANAEAQWCQRPGQSCWKVKRAAEALIESMYTSGGLTVRDEAGSQDAFIAKRQVDSLALAIAAAQHNPYAYYGSLGLGAQFAPETSTTEKRDASPEAQWCQRPGQSCWKLKRDPSPQWCQRPGQSCWKAKRAAEAVMNAIEAGEHEARSMPFDPETRVSKREADAEASCNSPGGACTYATRDLHAIVNVARDILDTHTA
ncbi:hypothetical protein B0T16DRAFT_501797 [Cercophora newfieldiana]|uniref:Clock-controlled pheromone ccg-4 n=1 Tax=Cercophora newfieldiana TaxID=92897 RepID=A0AA39YR45_9PEZI|nr:hypothetical protein B0T16DRAFT_501797 [Cercophora newfieldiana]